MIPPNMNAIIYAKVANASVADLFLATVAPGVLWIVLYMIINRFMVPKYLVVTRTPEELAADMAQSKALSTWKLFKALLPGADAQSHKHYDGKLNNGHPHGSGGRQQQRGQHQQENVWTY